MPLPSSDSMLSCGSSTNSTRAATNAVVAERRPPIPRSRTAGRQTGPPVIDDCPPFPCAPAPPSPARRPVTGATQFMPRREHEGPLRCQDRPPRDVSISVCAATARTPIQEPPVRTDPTNAISTRAPPCLRIRATDIFTEAGSASTTRSRASASPRTARSDCSAAARTSPRNMAC